MKVSVGIDIGGTNTVFGVVDGEGGVLAEGTISTAAYKQFDDFMAALCGGVKDLLATLDDYSLVGVGVGAPNANLARGTIEQAPNLPWQGVVPFVETMQAYFAGVPIYITNDANAATIGEKVYGAAKGMKDFIVITLGTGLGSGLVCGGQLVYGSDGFAGELGHTTIDYNGRECGCGRRGCLETYVSATGIKRTVFELMAQRSCDSPLRKVPFNDLTSKMIGDAADAGDPLALEAFEYTGLILGRALANFVVATSPEAIFLFGGLAKAGQKIFEPTQKSMDEHMFPIFRGKVSLRPSGIDDKNAAVLGASALVWQNI